MSNREDLVADARDWGRELLHGDPPPAWLDRCVHGLGSRGIETCETEEECQRRHPHCTCPEAHEQATECGPWLAENPPDVDVRTD